MERPTDVLLEGCNSAGHWLEKMSWTVWGPDGADGTGTDVVKTCTPDCASDRGTRNPVVVHASNPQPASPGSGCPAGIKFYADLVLAFPETLPPSEQVPTDITFQGMPAIQYSAKHPFCT